MVFLNIWSIAWAYIIHIPSSKTPKQVILSSISFNIIYSYPALPFDPKNASFNKYCEKGEIFLLIQQKKEDKINLRVCREFWASSGGEFE